MIVLIQLYLSMIECWHDLHVIKGSDKSEHYHNSKYHKFDALLWFSIYTWMAVEHNDPVYILTGLSIRLFMLQVVLNKLRDLPVTYLGGGFIDKFCLRWFGEVGTLCVKSVLFILTFLYEIISCFI